MDVLIVDDEPLARQRLARMIDSLDGHHVAGEAGTAEQALRAIEQQDPDVVLLDVRMPGEDGLSAAEQISRMDDPPAIIFCTAYDQYALDAFGTEAVGYLLKPVKREDLEQALTKAQRLNKVQLASAREHLSSSGRQHVTAKTRFGMEVIPMEDVRYFLADQKYVTVYHVDGEHLLDEPLKELEREFSDQLLRVHRNALVSIPHIEGVERTPKGKYFVRLADVDYRPAVSRRHVSRIKSLLQNL